jgi:hypothetical protein
LYIYLSTQEAAMNPQPSPSIEQQTGWKRPYPQTICQELDVLERVTQFDYDLGDVAFQRFIQSRCGIYLAAPKNEGLEAVLQTPPNTEHVIELLSRRPADASRVQRVTFAKPQDAWELYSAGQPAETQPCAAQCSAPLQLELEF